MMNELDNLKDAWKTISEAESKKEYSVDDLKKIVKKRSNTELSKIRRKFILEWTVAIILSVFMVLFVHVINPSDTKYALLFIFVILLISFFPYINVLKLKFSNNTNLKEYLKEFIFRFDNLIKIYIRMSTILGPIAGLGGFLLGLHSTLTAEQWNDFFSIWNLVLVVLFVIIISIVACKVQRWYYKWIYGKNLQRLRDCLNDLDEADGSS